MVSVTGCGSPMLGAYSFAGEPRCVTSRFPTVIAGPSMLCTCPSEVLLIVMVVPLTGCLEGAGMPHPSCKRRHRLGMAYPVVRRISVESQIGIVLRWLIAIAGVE